jgi:ABC-type amino acid transport substrate-binding protein
VARVQAGPPTPTPVPATPSPATPAPSPSPRPTPTPSPTAVPIYVPPDQLVFTGKLLICSDPPYPPQESLDEQGNPIGSDIEIGQDIGGRSGLTVVVVLSGLSLGVTKEGISVDNGHPELRAAVQTALSQMVKDGTYLRILKNWGQGAGNVFTR